MAPQALYDPNIGTKQKALRINLDPNIYGSFAEIGAGQDVAANFFKAGGASGTIAKTISAYDMDFSDAIYGEEPSGRYVCEPRLQKMLDREYKLLQVRLTETADTKTFFSFADTVSALNYKKTNEAHGWLGLKFQLRPNSKPNEVVVHVRMLDTDNILQQQAIGIIGVNLLYACYFYHENPETMLRSLMDDLSHDRIEIDMVRFNGPDFKHVDNRLMSLYLVKYGFSNAAIFGPDGSVINPAEAFYKKHILAVRGRFRPLTNANLDLFTRGKEQFLLEPTVDDDQVLAVSELTLRNLSDGDQINEADFLARVDILCSMGQTVMISNFHEYYRLVEYLTSFSKKRMAIVMGLPNLDYIFDEKHYQKLRGGILEAFGKLFGADIKFFIYPTQNQQGELCTTLAFKPAAHLSHLLEYLKANDKIADIDNVTQKFLHIYNDNVLEMITNGEPGWEEMVPNTVVALIKSKALFGYKAI
jgi:hypothetical protein